MRGAIERPTGPTTEIQGYVTRPNRPAVGLVAGGGALAAVVAALATGSGPLGVVMGVAALYFATSVARGKTLAHLQRVTVRASASALQIEDERLIPAADITEAKTLPQAGGSVMVRLTLRRGTETIRMLGRDAPVLLHVLGRSPGQRRTTFVLLSRYRTRFMMALALVGVSVFAAAAIALPTPPIGALLTFSLFAVVIPAALLAWGMGLVHGTLVIGADGFRRGWLFHRRFIPFREVAHVEREVSISGASNTVVTLRTGKKVRLRVAGMSWGYTSRHLEGRALADHMTTAFQRSRARVGDAQSAATLLASRGETGREWLARVDGMVRDGGAHYRVAAIQPETLVRIASDPAGAVVTRVGAAAALVRSGDDGRALVRELSEACAEPELRSALTALGDGRTDDEIVQVLESVRRS